MAKRNLEPKIKEDDYMDNDPTCVQGATSLVTWFIQSGKTQIHIAKANIREAQFDMCIIPVNVKLQAPGTGLYDIQNNYKDEMRQTDKHVDEGNVVWCHQSGKFACKEVALAVVITANGHWYKVVQDILREVATSKLCTIGIMINAGYDVTKFVRTLMEQRNIEKVEKVCVFLCTQYKKPDLEIVAKDIDRLSQTMKLPRRLASTEMNEWFPRLKIQTKIHRGSLLDTGCHSVVAAVGQDLNLKQGGVTKHIAAAAGEDTQKDLYDQKGSVEYWKVMCCHSGRLIKKKIRFLLFGCVPKWERIEDRVRIPKLLSKFIFGCLLTAHETGCSSIAIPLIGTGRLNYPERTVFASILDGIDLYTQLATLPRIQEVIIAFPNIDNDCYKMYVSELERRERMETKWLFKNTKVQGLSSTNTPTKYTIVNGQDLQDQLPIEYVEVVLNNSPGKTAGIQPQMNGGKLRVNCKITEHNVEVVMRRVVETCVSEKIANFVVYTSHLPTISAVTQVGGILDAFGSYKQQLLYLHKVWVVVSNAEEFMACNDAVSERNKHVSDISTRNTVNVGPIWRKKDLFHPNKDEGVNTVSANPNDEEPTDKTVQNQESALVVDKVTAEINLGVAQYLRSNSEVDTWTQTFKSVFDLRVFHTNGTMMLEGTLDNILRVEAYLETDFPNAFNISFDQPVVDQRNHLPSSNDGIVKVSKYSVQGKPTTKLQYKQSIKSTVQQKTTSKIPNNQSAKAWKDPLDIDNTGVLSSPVARNTNDGTTGMASSNNNSMVTTTTESQKNTSKKTINTQAQKTTHQTTDSFYTDKGMPYRINKMSVYVYQAKITTVPTVALVCPDAHTFQHNSGLSKHISSKAGQDCVQHWLKIPSQQKLEQCRCIVTQAGHLEFSKIIHVIRPTERATIHKAFNNILLECDQSNISSVAIPTIGAGCWPQNVHDCADQYYKALQAFGGSTASKISSLSEIHIVDRRQCTIDKVRSVFNRRVSEVPTDPIYAQPECLPFSVFSSTVAVTKQDMFSFRTDIKVLTTNDNFSDEAGCVKKALDRCQTFQSFFNGEKGRMHECSDIKWTTASDSLHCQNIIVAVRPWPRKPFYQGSIKEFKSDVQKIVKIIMDRCQRLKATLVAIPLMIHSDNSKVNDACCDAMAKEIIGFAQLSNLTVYVVTGDANYDRFVSVLTKLIYNKSEENSGFILV